VRSSAGKLFLVRHGETAGQSSIRYYGCTDIPLSDTGRGQIRAARAALIDRLRGFENTRVFSSPLVRATESARIITPADFPFTTIDEFRELNFGLFEGLTEEEIAERHPADHARWIRDRLSMDYTFPGGDNRGLFAERVARGIETALSDWSADGYEGNTLVVAHRGVIRAIVRHLTTIAPDVPLASIQILSRSRQWHADSLDLIDHLAGL